MPFLAACSLPRPLSTNPAPVFRSFQVSTQRRKGAKEHGKSAILRNRLQVPSPASPLSADIRLGEWCHWWTFRASRREALLLTVATLAVFVTRIGYLPTSLEDIDSVNFDLGVHDFNPFLHQPHPPGFPVFIALAKMVHPLFESHAAGLGFLSATCSSLVLPPLYFLARCMIGQAGAVLAVALAIFNPLFWLNSVRPMSDVTGFAVLLTAQALLLRGWFEPSPHNRASGSWICGVLMAGLAMGVRVQNAILVIPIIALVLLKHRRLFTVTAVSLIASCALWVIPTISQSGGVARIWARLQLLLSVAWASEPLASRPTWEGARQSAVDVLVLPWNEIWVACCVLLAASAGLFFMWRDVARRKHLAMLLVLFAPYAIYHFFFQETATTRYAIPTLPLIVVPAAFAASRLVRDHVPVMSAITAGLVMALAGLTTPTLSAYARNPSPPAQAIQRVAELAVEGQLVVTGDHVFERYLPDLAPVAQIIRPRPQAEWRALNRYWVAGNQRRVLYLRDPARSVLRLADPETQKRLAGWSWPELLRIPLKGMRPSDVELVQLDPPRWFAESGFMLTPEAGPPDRVSADRHLLFVRRDSSPDRLLVSGVASQPAVVTVFVDDTPRNWAVSGSFAVQVNVPARAAPTPYVPVRLEAKVPLLLTDVSVLRPEEDVVRPISGFYMPERDEENREFRWMGPTADVLVSRSGGPVRLTLQGSIPAEHVTLPLALQVRHDGVLVGNYTVRDSDFSIGVDLAPTDCRTSLLTLSTSQSFVPDKLERNRDTRRLALRIYALELDSRFAAGQRAEPGAKSPAGQGNSGYKCDTFNAEHAGTPRRAE
jgi:Dolichyl-phosphate-mannose-protein mannosyltransferase